MDNIKQNIQRLEQMISFNRYKLEANRHRIHQELQEPGILPKVMAASAIAGFGLIFLATKSPIGLIGHAKRIPVSKVMNKVYEHKHRILPLFSLLKPMLTKYLL